MSSGQSTPPPNPVLQYYQNWSEKTPYVTRTTTIGLVVVFLLTIFWNADVYLGNTTYFTLMSFEIYRIILSPLVGNSVFALVFIFLIFPQLGMKLESTMGSGQFLSTMGTITILSNVGFNVICLLLYFMKNAEALFWNACGFLPIIFGVLTIECMQMPEGTRRLLFIPYDIPNKYYPLILYALFSLFGGFQIDQAVAIAVGYAYSKGYLDRLRLSSYFIEEAEAAGGALHQVSRARGWVLAGATIGHDAWIALNSAEATGGGGVGHQSGVGSSRSQGAGASNNVYGVGSFSGGSSSAGGHDAGHTGTIAQPKDSFAGSGHKLSGGSQSSVSKEEMAARRLAALEAGRSNEGR